MTTTNDKNHLQCGSHILQGEIPSHNQAEALLRCDMGFRVALVFAVITRPTTSTINGTSLKISDSTRYCRQPRANSLPARRYVLDYEGEIELLLNHGLEDSINAKTFNRRVYTNNNSASPHGYRIPYSHGLESFRAQTTIISTKLSPTYLPTKYDQEWSNSCYCAESTNSTFAPVLSQ